MSGSPNDASRHTVGFGCGRGHFLRRRRRGRHHDFLGVGDDARYLNRLAFLDHGISHNARDFNDFSLRLAGGQREYNYEQTGD